MYYKIKKPYQKDIINGCVSIAIRALNILLLLLYKIRLLFETLKEILDRYTLRCHLELVAKYFFVQHRYKYKKM